MSVWLLLTYSTEFFIITSIISPCLYFQPHFKLFSASKFAHQQFHKYSSLLPITSPHILHKELRYPPLGNFSCPTHLSKVPPHRLLEPFTYFCHCVSFVGNVSYKREEQSADTVKYYQLCPVNIPDAYRATGHSLPLEGNVRTEKTLMSSKTQIQTLQGLSRDQKIYLLNQSKQYCH